MARTLQTFVSDLPARALRIAVHVGEQRAPSLAGSIDLEDFRGEDGVLDVARVVGRVEAIADNAGYPRSAPSLALRAYGEDGRRPLDTFQRTADGWEGAAGSGPGGRADVRDLAFMRLVDANLEACRILRENAADLSRALVNERTERRAQEDRYLSEREERAELEVAVAQLEQAAELNEAATDAEVKVRAIEAFEKVAEHATFKPAKLKALLKKNPSQAKALVAELMTDPEVIAILNT